jgi:hypothetical protein
MNELGTGTKNVACTFLHKSIQEYFTALHIAEEFINAALTLTDLLNVAQHHALRIGQRRLTQDYAVMPI